MATTSTSPSSLLLLPSLSLPLNRASLRTAYGPTFSTLLRKITQARTGKPPVVRLDIALILSSSYPVSPPTSRTAMFPHVQTLLEETYRLLCIIAAQEKIDLDFPGGIDARIFMLERRSKELPEEIKRKQSLSGPLLDVYTFALSVTSGREYTSIYSVEGEEGVRLAKAMIQILRKGSLPIPELEYLPCGTAVVDSQSYEPIGTTGTDSRGAHRSVAVGGTFDHLHVGHKLLLTATVLLAEPWNGEASSPRLITIGITGDALLTNKKFAAQVESWDERQRKTAEFVESILCFHPQLQDVRRVEHIDKPGSNGKLVRVSFGDELAINYVQISDPFGPTITDENITALVISQETRAGGKAVNDKRTEKGWKALQVFEVDVLDASSGDGDDGQVADKETFENKISSTEIRKRLEDLSKK